MTSKPLTFKELHAGDRFVFFPADGDDHGHGGFRMTHYIFIKVDLVRLATSSDNHCYANAVQARSGNTSLMPDDMEVLKVE